MNQRDFLEGTGATEEQLEEYDEQLKEEKMPKEDLEKSHSALVGKKIYLKGKKDIEARKKSDVD